MFIVLGDLLSLAFRLPRIPFIRSSDGAAGAGGYIDPRSKGGANRAKILELINSRPANANQISEELSLDYKTVVHHLRVLSENGLVITENKDSYGATYFLTPLMEKNITSFREILARIGTK
jgi:DNA-binding transcriptional ArsR family regulator